ncbi:MAG: DUF2589 domain-containing protein [Salibacteraceae bacterium]
MADLPTGSLKPGGSNSLDIESLISAPLVAAATANSMMAREQAKFILDFCFAKNGGNYRPVMIAMSLSRSELVPDSDPNAKPRFRQVNTTFNLPLLTIIPLNALAVTKATVQFEMEMTNQMTETTKVDSKSQVSAPKLMGRISYDSSERTQRSGSRDQKGSNSSSLKVNINAEQLPIPTGMATILELYTKAIHPIEQPNGKKNKRKNQ